MRLSHYHHPKLGAVIIVTAEVQENSYFGLRAIGALILLIAVFFWFDLNLNHISIMKLKFQLEHSTL